MAGNLIDIKLLGDKKLQRKLNRLVPRVQKKVVRQALRKAAKPVLAATKQKVSELRVTGKHTDLLRKGLKIRAVRRSRVKLGVLITTPVRRDIGIPEDAKWYWPAHIELGSSKAPAQPYMRNAMDETRTVALGIAKRELAAGIIREAIKA